VRHVSGYGILPSSSSIGYFLIEKNMHGIGPVARQLISTGFVCLCSCAMPGAISPWPSRMRCTIMGRRIPYLQTKGMHNGLV